MWIQERQDWILARDKLKRQIKRDIEEEIYKKTQSKRMSLIESLTNVGFWILISLLANMIIFPFFWIYIWFSSHLIISIIFTIISIIRSYLIRRFFTNYVKT